MTDVDASEIEQETTKFSSVDPAIVVTREVALEIARQAKNALLEQAVEEGHWYVDRKGRPKIEWKRFIDKKRHWLEVPLYFGFTQEEVECYMKSCVETMVPIQVVRKLLGYHTRIRALQFLQMKEIPIYMIPTGVRQNVRKMCWSGDIIRAIESCRLDQKANHAMWAEYLKFDANFRDSVRAWEIKRMKSPAGSRKRRRASAASGGTRPTVSNSSTT